MKLSTVETIKIRDLLINEIDFLKGLREESYDFPDQKKGISTEIKACESIWKKLKL